MAKKAAKTATKRAAAKKPVKKAAAKAPRYILKANEIGARQQAFTHPWNPKSEMFGVRLADALGLKRVGVAIARLPAGNESFVPHAHHHEEEWIYVLMGTGAAVIDGKEHAIGMGDFIAFPAPQPAHQLKNTGMDDLVYLMGGEKLAFDVVDFPAQGKTLVRENGRHIAFDTAAASDPFAAPVKRKKG